MQISGSITCWFSTSSATAMSISASGLHHAPNTAASTEAHVVELDRLPVDAHHRRGDPAGELARLDHAAHQAGDERAVLVGGQPLPDLVAPLGFADHAAVGRHLDAGQ